MKSKPIPADLFIRNRKKLAGLVVPGSLLVVCSAERMPRNGDQFYPFRQQSDFFYLTGINQEGSILVMLPGNGSESFTEILFVRKPDPKTELWSGPLLTVEMAASQSGIREVRWLEELDHYFRDIIPSVSRVYFNHAEHVTPDIRIKSPDTLLYEKISSRFPGLATSRQASILMQLRMIKEYEELEEIRKAGDITRSAFLRVLGRVKPGIGENEVEAELTAEFLAAGAEGHAYEPIVAGGRNALILHYVNNNCRCNENDLILMDFGAEVNNYGVDCSRTIPVNGRFTDRQLELYNAVLRVFKQAREMMVPGAKLDELHQTVGSLMEQEHIRLGLYTRAEADLQNPKEPKWKEYFVHGTSHSLGLDVHDPFDRTKPFQSGMVLTLEPAIYIPAENTGIRIENDILITEEGPVDLLEDIPIEAEEIEDIMNASK